jgi:hypothetical protein
MERLIEAIKGLIDALRGPQPEPVYIPVRVRERPRRRTR